MNIISRTLNSSNLLGLLLYVLAGGMLVACGDNEIVDKGKFVMHFSEEVSNNGDLYREIPAEGGTITIFSADDSSTLHYLTGCFLINQPLGWYDNHREEYTIFICEKYFRVFPYCKIPEDGVELFIFKDGYSFTNTNKYVGYWFIPLFYDVRQFDYAEVEWLNVRFYKDKIEVDAAANDTGKDRYFSFIYDNCNGPNYYYGAIEIKQPAAK